MIVFEKNFHDVLLLDAPSLRFILVTGAVKGLLGVAMLVALPLLGFGLAVTRTVVFLYESIAQLVFAYPSRRISVIPLPNAALQLAVAFGIGLQVLTISLPGLRELLGLVPPGWAAALWMTGAVLATWAVAEIYSRAALGRADPGARPEMRSQTPKGAQK